MDSLPSETEVANGVSNAAPVPAPAGAVKPATNGTVLVKAWVGDANGSLTFPERDDAEFALPALNSDKAPLAVCISGGGFRAATLALGWLRGLQKLGVLEKAMYLVTCSGSSWTGSALCFQKVAELDEFLGKNLAPEECSLEALKQVGIPGRSFAAAVAEAKPYKTFWGELTQAVSALLSPVIKPDVIKPDEEARAWTKTMAKSFLEPFGLGKTDKSTVTCSGTKGDVHMKIAERAAEAGRGAVVYEADVQKLPYLIICQDVLLRDDPSGVKYYPFEWTPLYGGCPVPYSSTTPKLGCGWVETLGLNAVLEGPEPPSDSSAAPGSQQPLHLRVRTAGPASLGEAMGISSAYVSILFSPFPGHTPIEQTIYKTLGFHTASYFNMQDWSNGTISLTDGGGTDLHAVYPALRRKVANVMVLSATETPVLDYDAFVKHRKEICLMFGCWPGEQKDPAGVAPTHAGEAAATTRPQEPRGANITSPSLSADEMNNMFKVFPSKGFSELYAALKAKVEAGEPAVHVATYQVHANSFMGIPGGWNVRVMWVINDRQTAWEARLPQDTRDRLEAERSNPVLKTLAEVDKNEAVRFHSFPHVSTLNMDYPPELVGLMAAHAAHMLVANRDAVNQMLEPVVVVGSKE